MTANPVYELPNIVMAARRRKSRLFASSTYLQAKGEAEKRNEGGVKGSLCWGIRGRVLSVLGKKEC